MAVSLWGRLDALGLPGFLLLALLGLLAVAALLELLPPRPASVTAGALLAGTVAGILTITLRRYPGIDFSTVQWVPLRDLVAAFDPANIKGEDHRLQLFANVVMFAPVGLALARLTRGALRRVLVAALLLSVSVEVLQAVLGTGRRADVNDVVVNVAGALLGFLAWRLTARLLTRRRKAAASAS